MEVNGHYPAPKHAYSVSWTGRIIFLLHALLHLLRRCWTAVSEEHRHPGRVMNELQVHIPKTIKMKLHRPTLVLDLDETLVHTTLKRSDRCDVKIDVVMHNQLCEFYVFKRPHVDTFLKHVTQWFDVVIFTASLQSYADPVIDHVDPCRNVQRRLFRESCVERQGAFVKDLSVIGRDLSQVLIIDNSPIAYSLNPDNALPIETWTCDPDDEELLNLLPLLAALCLCSDVRSILSLRTDIVPSPGGESPYSFRHR